MTGRLQVYTGNGKGKTTAALGLAVRAVGAGMRVYVAQFAKGKTSSEEYALGRLGDAVVIEQFGRETFLHDVPSPEDRAAARTGLERARGALASGDYDLVVLDEANIAVHYGLFSLEELFEALHGRAAHVEAVVTGRHACPELLAAADLVTEMREVKHYFNEGVPARKGIEN